MKRPDAATVSALLAMRALPLAGELLPNGQKRGQEWRVGSLGGEPGQSLGVRLTGARAGVWSDFATGQSGDALDLVAAVRFQGDLKRALKWSLDFLAVDPSTLQQHRHGPVAVRLRMAPAHDSKMQQRALEIWGRAISLPGTPAAVYVAGRRLLNLVPCTDLGFTSAVSHPAGGQEPAMVALVRDVDGAPVGLHRTFVTMEGQPAAHLTPRKASLGPVAGGAVRLQPAGSRLIVGEGIESAASAALLFGMPAWAALSTSGLRSLLLPPAVRLVVIAADADQPGEDAAQAAASRWRGEGRTVQIARPETSGCDFNDVWMMCPRA